MISLKYYQIFANNSFPSKRGIPINLFFFSITLILYMICPKFYLNPFFIDTYIIIICDTENSYDHQKQSC